MLLTIIVTVILLSTALFVVGVLIERSPTTLVPTPGSKTPPTSVSSADPDGGHECTASGSAEPAPRGAPPIGGSNERVFGLDLESPWLVGAFVLAWLLLMGALFRLGRMAWFALLVVALVTGILDVGEIARKVGEANTTVAIFAVVVAVAHVSLAALADLVLVRGRRGSALLPSAGRGVL